MLINAFKSEEFVIGQGEFADLQINAAPAVDKLYYFYHTKERRLITQFVLDARPQVLYICHVQLIKKEAKFTPRLSFSIRDKRGKIVQRTEGVEGTSYTIKANVSLERCHENFWKLISFLQSLRNIEVPRSSFSLVSQGETEIVTALRGRDTQSIVNIIKQLSTTEGIKLSPEDVNQLLRRREVLEGFVRGLRTHPTDEDRWQNFFERNKWIFGYGLNYHILRQEQSQPHYGGTRVDGKGGQRGDFLTSTVGDINFTVLVEIKTPATLLVQVFKGGRKSETAPGACRKT